jgi:flagellar hook-basal body complex protein FliE
MDKINPLGIQQTQQKILQEMHRTATVSAGAMMPTVNPLTAATPGQSVDFSTVMQRAINGVNQQQLIASAKQEAVEMGLSDDLMGTMVESQKASISFSAMMEVRNKLTSALDQIMNISL